MYYIQTKDRVNNRDVTKWDEFKPFPHQKKLLHKLFRENRRRLLVPKARRMGFSTLINIAQLDSCLNTANFHSKIIDQSQADATDKLVHRIQKAWQHMEDTWGDLPLRCLGKNQSEVRWSNGSLFTADTSGRGGSAVHFEHVSELGPIDFEDPKRADEIIDGAFPAADGGIIVVESTAKGPKGHFKRLCDNAQKIPEADRTVDDWDVLFFAWHDDPRHARQGKMDRISSTNHQYLDHIQEVTGKVITPEQRLWYHITSETTSRIKYEYPSLLEECWEQPVEGAIYANLINRAREEGRVGHFPHSDHVPVHTIWDLGGPQNTRCVFLQLIDGKIVIVDAQMGGSNLWGDSVLVGPNKPSDWVELLRNKPYFYGSHILPHDGNMLTYLGSDFQQSLATCGLKNTTRIDRRKGAANERIDQTSMQFNRFFFNIENPNVDVAVKHLELYHRVKETDGISWKDEPKGDFCSHYADAFGDIINAEAQGKFSDGSSFAERNRVRRRRSQRVQSTARNIFR
jgi:hypothetical protein